MYVCKCVCVYIYTYIHITHSCTHLHIHTYTYIHLHFLYPHILGALLWGLPPFCGLAFSLSLMVHVPPAKSDVITQCIQGLLVLQALSL